MSKYTAGPWSLELHPTSIGSMYRIKQPRACIYVDGMRAPNVKDTAWDEDHANARLISAAPDLLEALEQCLNCEFPVEDKVVIEAARAAIRKAKGE